MNGKNVNFSNLVSLVALTVCFGLQDNSDTSFMHLFYLILHHEKQENCACYFAYVGSPVLL